MIEGTTNMVASQEISNHTITAVITMRDRIQVDIGVGDVVEPKDLSWSLYQYKGQPFVEDLILLRAYPVESIFSEKLETSSNRGGANLLWLFAHK